MNKLIIVDPSNPISIPRGALSVTPRLSYSALEQYCWRHLEPVDIDLVILLNGIAYADRRLHRHRAERWARQIEIHAPVHDPTAWHRASELLVSMLHFLTGDEWTFSFRKHSKPDPSARYLDIQRPLRDPAVLPFSGGLDSFSLARSLVVNKPRDLIMISAQHSSVTSWRLLEDTLSSQLVVPFSLGAGEHSEPTYRTRTLVFFSLAALAARLAGVKTVQIGEPGPGALGPELIPFADEHPYRGSSPLFTSRLRGFLETLWQAPIQFEHPNLWQTKAQTLQHLIKAKAANGWELTRSCSREIRRRWGGKKTQCGICSNCLSRRMSCSAVGLSSSTDANSYLWTINESTPRKHTGSPKKAKIAEAERDAASFAVVGLSELARVPLERRRLLAARMATAGLGNELDLLTQVETLVNQHSLEWQAFLDSLPEKSWVRTIDNAARASA